MTERVHCHQIVSEIHSQTRQMPEILPVVSQIFAEALASLEWKSSRFLVVEDSSRRDLRMEYDHGVLSHNLYNIANIVMQSRYSWSLRFDSSPVFTSVAVSFWDALPLISSEINQKSQFHCQDAAHYRLGHGIVGSFKGGGIQQSNTECYLVGKSCPKQKNLISPRAVAM